MFAGGWSTVPTGGGGGGGGWSILPTSSGGGGWSILPTSGGGGGGGWSILPTTTSGGGGWSTLPLAPIAQAPGPAQPDTIYGGGAYPITGAGMVSAGPYGEGVYVPIDYPSLRFLGQGEKLRSSQGPMLGGSMATWLALGAVALLLLKK